MDRLGSIFIEIKKQINYIINDNEILYLLIPNLLN